MKYAFELGHQPHISRAEVETVLHTQGHTYTEAKQTGSFFILTTTKVLPVQDIMNILGGCISINEHIGPTQNILEDAATFLEKQEGKIQFSIRGAGKRAGLDIKKELKSRGRSVRYIEPKNTATITHNNLIEKQGNLIHTDGHLYVTAAVQNIESFADRDYERPGWDDVSGMLPPKLARMMINLSGTSTEAVLLDPFCGSGTVLLEALDLGYTIVYGTDLSAKAIQDSKQNITWFSDNHNTASVKTSVAVRDVRTLPKQFAHSKQQFDVIVSEPYMGKPLHGKETKNILQKQANELATLYADAFASFKKVATKGATIIFIIPQFNTRDGWVRIDCVDAILKKGFTQIPFSPEHTTLLYHRPHQHVGREIFKFQVT